MLKYILAIVTQDHNQMLQIMLDIEELKQVVFSMSPHSGVGPDGMNGKFFQACWNIINRVLLAIVPVFFCWQIIPKYFSHAYFVLLPKVAIPNKLSEFRPICLSNFINKVISKLLCLG